MEEVEILKRVAVGAGEILKSGFFAKKEVMHKGIVDLVTEFDKRAEDYILEELSKEFKGFDLVAEESYSGGGFKSRAIFIDPLDGTTNFVHNLPFFAVSIGLYQEDGANLAVVFNPILDEMFWAVEGAGAFKNSSKLSVSTQKKLQNSLIATGFPYAKVEAGKEYRWSIESIASILPKIQDLRRFGAASLDLCYVAEGRFEGFFEIGLNPWDVAGGALIVKESGGKVSKTNGDEYNFGDFDIVATNGLIHNELVSAIESWED